MTYIPEPSLLPPELPEPPLRCSLCLQTVTEALELFGRPVCRPCLLRRSTDELSALLCAPILTQPAKEVYP